MALSQLNFQETTREGQTSLRLADGLFPQIAASARRALGVARIRSGSMRLGRLLCEEAAEQAKRLCDPRLISETLLALAEAMLDSGDAPRGLENAVRAQEQVAQFGQQDSEWRAWLIAAQASRLAEDRSEASQFASNAASKLSTIEQLWGTAAYTSYLTRPDVKQFRKQIGQMLASGK